MPFSIWRAKLANGPVTSSTAPTLIGSCALAPPAPPASSATAAATPIFFSFMPVSPRPRPERHAQPLTRARVRFDSGRREVRDPRQNETTSYSILLWLAGGALRCDLEIGVAAEMHWADEGLGARRCPVAADLNVETRVVRAEIGEGLAGLRIEKDVADLPPVAAACLRGFHI